MSPTAASSHRAPSPWPGRLALWTFVASVPLILFGGAVTTMRAGMAEDGWLRPDGYLLWLYPWAMRIRDAGVFVEHHHRELGSLVGLLSIATVVVTFAQDRRRSARTLAMGALLAIAGQGAIGGFRVLENNPELAFLHGALAQAVFAFLAVVALVLSRGWRSVGSSVDGEADRGPGTEWRADPRLRGLASVALLATFGQAVLGAWLRHGHSALALALHATGAIAVAAAIVATGLRFRRASDAAADPSVARLARRAGRHLFVLLGLQVALGIASTVAIYGVSGGMRSSRISSAELVFATLHVAVGALLLASLARAAVWAWRLAPRTRVVHENGIVPEGSAA